MGFLSGRTKRYTKDPYPPIEMGNSAVMDIVEEAIKEGALGLDLEYNPATQRPYIIGVASKERAAANWWKNSEVEEIIERCRETKTPIVGHNVLGADKPVIERTLGITTDVELWDDSMLRGYLCNSDWCSAPGKEEDAKDQGSLGLMNLGTMSTYYLDIPMYKQCRGEECFGPCPTHEERSYCAVDAWAGLKVAEKAKEEMKRRGMSEKLYQDMKRLTLYCDKMREQGIKIDRDLVAQIEEGIKTKKGGLFPSEMKLPTERCKKERKFWLTPFNPNSPKQVAEWFKEQGIELKAKKGSPTSRDTIRISLERELRRLRIPYEIDKKFGTLTINDDISMPDAIEYLYRLDQYKRASKGAASWFNDKYFDEHGFIHPRFIVTGTSTGRLASSSPNCFDKETEVLTQTGWKFIKDLTTIDRVAQYNNTERKLEFVLPTRTTRRQYSGQMVNLVNQHIRLRVTADHRCLLINRKTKEDHVYAAKDYPEDKIQLNAACLINTETRIPLTDDEIRWLVAVQADGHLTPHGVDFSFSKTRKTTRLRQLLHQLDYRFRDYTTLRRMRLLVTELHGRELVDKYLGPQKLFGDWILEFTPHQLEVFCDEVFYWDGTYKTRSSYASKHYINASYVQTAFTLLERRAKIRKYISAEGSCSWQVDVSKHGYSMTTNIEKILENVVDETVYCLSVPSSFVLVRRHGRTAITGQCQNIPKRGLGSLIRAAVVPRSPHLKILKADCRQLELRIVLFYAGADQPEDDAFSWLVGKAGGAFDAPAARFGMKARDIAKSLAHAGNYLEGLVLLSEDDLRTETRRREIKAGALVVLEDWIYRGKVVGFNGANLAERLFGDKTYAHRKEALDLQEIYFSAFPAIRRWHQSVSNEIERSHSITSRTGRSLELYGTPEEDLKLGCAFLGQGGGADEVQECMLRFDYLNQIALIQVHDELVFEVPREWSKTQMVKFFEPFCEPSERFGGVRFPIEISCGENWCGKSELNPMGLEVIE